MMSHEIKKTGSSVDRISHITVNDRFMKWRRNLTVEEVCTIGGYKEGHFTVFVNGVAISSENYNTYKVPKKAIIKIMYLVHGG
jgi:thiamine biosynthesis protein ThiS